MLDRCDPHRSGPGQTACRRRTATWFRSGTILLCFLLASTAGAVAQVKGRWSSGPSMLSERTVVAVAEVGGRIYVVGGSTGERELEISIRRPGAGAEAPNFRARSIMPPLSA
jgi:hypothetical protein